MQNANALPPSGKVTEGKIRPLVSRAKPKVLEQMREDLRVRHYSRRTEQVYCSGVKRLILFHHLRHPAEMAEPETNGFLIHLIVNVKVGALTQNYALSAFLFSNRHAISGRSNPGKQAEAPY